MGARLERLKDSRLLTITDGAPANGADAVHHGFSSLDAYREARRSELLAALAHAGLPAAVAPVFSAAVPDQAASLHLVDLARALAQELQTFQPEAVLTHPYEGGHPDHDACAFAVHAAVRLAQGSEARPVPVLEAPFYHAGEGSGMQTGTFLPDGEASAVFALELSPQEQRNKAARLACFPSQAETLAQFGTEAELFRLAPAYDFTQRPHPGQLFYERFPWGMDGNQFCRLAREAVATLFPASLPSAAAQGSTGTLAAV